MSYSKVDLLILSISVIWVKSLTFFPDQLLRGKLRGTSVTYLDNSKNSQPLINPASCLAKTHLRCVLARQEAEGIRNKRLRVF